MLGLSGWADPHGVSHHLPHLVMMAAPFAVFVGVLGVQWRLDAAVALPATVWCMVAATAAGGVVHGAVTAHHAHEAPLLGWAMAALSLAQLTWSAAVLFVPSARLVETGVLGNLAVVVLWAWTRLVGVPLGLAGGQRERIGAADLTATLLEVAAVLLGLAWRSGLQLPVPGHTRLRTTPST